MMFFQQCNSQNLSFEIVYSILLFLSPSEQIMFFCTCKGFKELKKDWDRYEKSYQKKHSRGIDSKINSRLKVDALRYSGSDKVEIWFAEKDSQINFFREFFQLFYPIIGPEIDLSFKKETIEQEWKFYFWINKIKTRITKRNVVDLLQLFGEDKFSKSCNLKIINKDTSSFSFINNATIERFSSAHELYFQVYYGQEAVALIVNAFLINSLKSQISFKNIIYSDLPYKNIVRTERKSNGQKNYYISLPITPVVQNNEILQKFKFCLTKILTKKEHLRISEYLDKIVQYVNAPRKSDSWVFGR